MILKNNQAQDEALAKGWDKPEFAYFMEPGLGKTRTAIKNAEMLYAARKINRVLIFAPGGVIRNWSFLEIPKHLDPAYHHETYVHQWRGGRTVSEKEVFRRFASETSGLRILCMNIEALSAAKYGEQAARAFLSRGDSMIVIDESTTIGNYGSSRSKSVHSMLHLSKYRRVMTGTPFCGGPDKVFSQMLGLSPYVVGLSNIFAFRARYALVQKMNIKDTKSKDPDKKRSISVVRGFLREKELKEKIEQKAFFASKKDYLDLPDKIRTIRHIDLTVAQCRIINDIRENWLAQLGPESFVSVKNALGVRLRILQVYAGHTVDSISGSVIDIPSNRVKQLMEQLEEYGPGCVIWSMFKRSHDHLRETLGDKAVFYNGETPADVRAHYVQRFQDGDADYFVGSMAGGFGLTLVRASSEIYYSPVPSVEARIQTGDRTHRIGQKNSVVSCDLIVEGGLDDKIRKAHLSGSDLSGEMMRKDQAEEYLFGRP